jgi:hypothetical protein
VGSRKVKNEERKMEMKEEWKIKKKEVDCNEIVVKRKEEV